MSLQAPIIYCLPEETARVAHAAFPKGTPYLRMRDVLGPIYLNPDFAALFPATGQPAYAPAQLALVTIMQFAEGLSDAQAADAVRSRIDWKYVLALDLTDSGFHSSVLTEFRTRLVAGHAEHLLFETMLTLFREHGLLKARGRQRTDSTHVLAAIQVLNRLECIGETLRHALNTVATVAPAWLRAWVPAAWFDRYGRRFEEYRLPPGKADRYALAAQIGTDGQVLLQTIYAPTAPAWVREIPAVQVLRRVWIQQFYAVPNDQPMRWRIAGDLPSAQLLISSPYDPEARYTKRRDTEWTGYKVHLTETCEDDLPNLITDVTTTTAPILDSAMLPTIQAQLAARHLTPQEHLVDSGYMTADHFRNSRQDYDSDLVGPASTNRSWQAQGEGAFAATQFVIDWEARRATCPQGKTSAVWVERENRHGQAAIQIRFAKKDCATCVVRAQCTTGVTQGRAILLRDRDHALALHEARQRQQTPAWTQAYARRAGIEGTISQGVRIGDVRRSRYRGLAKTRLLHCLIAAALNFLRVGAWLCDTPRSHTRPAAFAALARAG